MSIDRYVGRTVFVFMMLVSTDASAITGGNESETCDWPSVVYLKSRSGDACSGVYIGGRVVITAAHCDDGNGFYYNYEEIHEHLGVASALQTACSADAQCPSVTIAGSSVQLKCDDNPSEHPSPAGSCYLDDEDLIYTNFALEALFGEAYDPYGTEQPTNSVPIQYCRLFEHGVSGSGWDSDDFAYCVLTQEPDVAPVPLLMHCEADEFLDGTYALDVVAVGFGQAAGSGAGNEVGRKRWASASTNINTDIASSDLQISLIGDFSTFSPGYPASSDSGSGLFLQLPDESWRLMGVNVTVAPNFAITPWNFVDWMLTDAEVSAQIDDLIPCHDDDGTWNPGAGCTSFPVSPDDGDGAWSRGPTACNDADVSGYSATCGSPYSPYVPPPSIAPATPTSPSPSKSESSCSMSGRPSGIWGIFFLVVAGALLRRRRRAAAILFCSLVVGCQDDSPLTEADDEVGSETGGSVAPLELNPNISNVTSGVFFPDTKYEEIAVGNIARTIGSSACCQDYVLGGETEPDALLIFGGGSTTTGLTFLADMSDVPLQMADMGEGIDDLELLDVDGDSDNDLVALLTNSELGVRLGNASPTTPFGAVNQYSAQSGMIAASGKIATGDMDCDGNIDVTATAPDSDAVVILLNNGSGVFGAIETFDIGKNPQDVAVGDLDGSGPLDIVTVNDDGTLSIGVADTCERARPNAEDPMDFVQFYDPDCMAGAGSSCVADTLDASVDIFPACGGQYNDVVVAFADSIFAYCNEGDGTSFDEGEYAWQPWTIRWDLNDAEYPADMKIYQARSPQLWQVPNAPAALFALNSKSQVIEQLSLENNVYGRNHLPVLSVRSGAHPLELVLSAHTGAGADWWERAAWVSDVRSVSLVADGQIGFGR